MKRKFLLLFLAFTLLISTIPVFGINTAKAEEDSRAVNLLAALGIMDKDPYTGLFWNDVPVMRGEFAEIICRLYKFEPTTDAVKKFTDVSESKRGAVETVVRNGIMNGYGDGRFGEEDLITVEQLAKVFVRVIGADGMVEDPSMTGYMMFAKRKKLLNGIATQGNEPAKRIDVAQIIYNALRTDLVKIVGYGELHKYEILKGVTFLSEELDIYCVEGIVNKIDSTSINRPDGAGEGYIEIDDFAIQDENKLADGFLGCKVCSYIQKDKADDSYSLIYIEEAGDNKVLSINGENISSVSDKVLGYYDENDKKQKVRFNEITDMIYNGKAIPFNKDKIESVSCVDVKTIDNNDDGICDLIIVNKFNDAIIDKISTVDESISLMYSGEKIILKNNEVRLFLDGESCKLDDYIAGTVISYAISENKTGDKAIRVEGSTDIVMGEISGDKTKSGSHCVTIGGTDYMLSTYAESLSGSNLPVIKVGLKGQFFLNNRGEIAYYSANSSTSVGFLIGVSDASSVWKFRIFTAQNRVEVLEASDRLWINDVLIKKNGFEYSGASIDILRDIKENICGKQLISYSTDDGKIRRITYSSGVAYDKNMFSYDVFIEKSNQMCRKSGVLLNKYTLTSDTMVFYVPSEYNEDYGKYSIYNGTYFGRGWRSNDVKLYDVGEDGTTNYALVIWDNITASHGVTSPVLLVDHLGEVITEEGEIVNAIFGYNKDGNMVELQIDSEEKMYDFDSSHINHADRVAPGDVIQYGTDISGEVLSFKILEHGDAHTFYGTTSDYGDDQFTRTCGYVINTKKSDNLLLSKVPPIKGMLATDENVISAVSNTTPIVFIYDSERETIEKGTYSDIEFGDIVFAAVNGNNQTQLLVIYR